MDATGYSIIGIPVVGIFAVLMAVVVSAATAFHASTWPKEYSQELTAKGVYELPIGLSFMGLASVFALYATNNFVWTAVAAVVSAVAVLPWMYAVDKREYNQSSIDA